MRQQGVTVKSFEKFKNIDNLLQRSTDISKMFGNYLKDEAEEVAAKRAAFYPTVQDFLKNLKQYRLMSKNYCNMFLTKTKVMIKLLNSLNRELRQKLRASSELVGREYHKIKKQVEGTALSQEQTKHFKDLENFKLKHEEFVKFKANELEKFELKETEDKEGVTVVEFVLLTNLYHFTSCFSNLIRKLEKEKNPNPTIRLNEEVNVQLLEMNLLLTFESVRSELFYRVLPFLFKVTEELKQRLDSCQKFIEGLKLGSKADVTSGAVRLAALIEPQIKRFIKKKIGMENKVIMKDDDLEDFIRDFYPFKYCEVSYLCRAFLECIEEKRNKKFLLMIDVASAHQCLGNIICVPRGRSEIEEKAADTFVYHRWIKDRVLFCEICDCVTIKSSDNRKALTISSNLVDNDWTRTFKIPEESASAYQRFVQVYKQFSDGA